MMKRTFSSVRLTIERVTSLVEIGRDAHRFVFLLAHTRNRLTFLGVVPVRLQLLSSRPHFEIHKGVRVPAAFNLNTHTRTHAHLAVCSITGFLHQLYSVFKTRLDTTFEWLGVPVASRSTRATVRIYSYKKHTELKHRRTRFWGFEDSRLRPRQGQCQTQTVRKQSPGTRSGEPSTCRDRSYRD